MQLGGQNQRARGAFQTLLLEGCISLNRINGGCSGTESHADEKNQGTKQRKGCFQLQRVFWGEQFLQVSSAGLLMVWSTWDGWVSALLSRVWCCNLSWHKESRRVQWQGEAPGTGGRLQVCTGRTVSWSQYWFVSEIITSDQCNSSTGLCEFIYLHRPDNCCFMKIALVSYSFTPNYWLWAYLNSLPLPE